MKHEDALMVRRLAQNNAPALAMEICTVEGDSGVTYTKGTQRVHSTDLPVTLRALASAITHLQPFLYCRGCDSELPREEFFNYRRGDPSRKQRLCKKCCKREQHRNYHKDPEAFRRRDKRYRLQGRVNWREEDAQRSRLNHRAIRLASRLARAELLIELWAVEYGLDEAQLYGPLPEYSVQRTQAMVLLVRTIRAWTYLHPEAIAELLNCPVEEIAPRIKEARKLTHSQQGDVRVRTRLARVRRRYDARCRTLGVARKPYMEYTPAQRLPGRARNAREEQCEEQRIS